MIIVTLKLKLVKDEASDEASATENGNLPAEYYKYGTLLLK